MLREFQEEIKRLKEQLDATQRGVMIGDDGRVEITLCDAIRVIRVICVWCV